MIGLEQTLREILNEKETKILPENIKKGVTIFGINGECEEEITDEKVLDYLMNTKTKIFYKGEYYNTDKYTVSPYACSIDSTTKCLKTNSGTDAAGITVQNLTGSSKIISVYGYNEGTNLYEQYGEAKSTGSMPTIQSRGTSRSSYAVFEPVTVAKLTPISYLIKANYKYFLGVNATTTFNIVAICAE